MSKNFTFSERTTLMLDVAKLLAYVGDIVADKAARMKAAADKFEKRRNERPTKKAA